MWSAAASLGCSADSDGLSPNVGDPPRTADGSARPSDGSDAGGLPEASGPDARQSDSARPDGSRDDAPPPPDSSTNFDSGVVSPGMPTIFYSDLDSGPNTGGLNDKGAFVTIYGAGFGSPRGSATVTIGGGAADNYLLWSDTKVSFQLGSAAATGDIVVHNGNGDSNTIPFTVRAGRILFVTPSGTGSGSVSSPLSPYAVYTGLQAGDTYYFRAGMYDKTYDIANWGNFNYSLGAGKSGSAGRPVAFVG